MYLSKSGQQSIPSIDYVFSSFLKEFAIHSVHLYGLFAARPRSLQMLRASNVRNIRRAINTKNGDFIMKKTIKVSCRNFLLGPVVITAATLDA